MDPPFPLPESEAAARPAGFARLPAGATTLRVLWLDLARLKTSDDGDLYLTKYGLPFLEHLKPENWYDADWFAAHRERLKGTSTVYKVATKPVNGVTFEIVVKWSRVGQDVPLQTQVLENVLSAEFNGPFEEFSLVEEMRSARYGPAELRILSHRPLAIYVPPNRLQLWQTGRSRYKINAKIRRNPGVEIDILRQYILIYEWIGGIDAVEAFDRGFLEEAQLHALTRRATEELARKGFEVADMKPAHIIVRARPDGTLAHRNGEILYALIDFELLRRLPELDELIRRTKRHDYLLRQRDRFTGAHQEPLPPNLQRVTIFGVEYIHGRVESTNGALWVVGRDPQLFDYFQPERWRKTICVKLSENHQVYCTKTKDAILLVWKSSRVGEAPEVDLSSELGERMIEHGFNSPFEEIAIAMDLTRKGIPTTYPRAIYRTGSTKTAVHFIPDSSRYKSHAHLTTPAGEPILQPNHDYITLWGYWHEPIERLAEGDSESFQGIDAWHAMQEGLLPAGAMQALLDQTRLRLAALGYEALGLIGQHLMLSVSRSGFFMRDRSGQLETRISNFEFIRRPECADAPPRPH